MAGTTNEDAALTFTLKNFINGAAGTTAVADANTGANKGGVAIVGVTGKGAGEYQVTSTSGWKSFGTISPSSALLLSNSPL